MINVLIALILTGLTDCREEFGLVIEWHSPRLYPHQLPTTRIVCGDRETRQQHNCIVTKEERPDTDAYIFYGPDLDRELELLPWSRRSDIRWALINPESPINNYILVQPEIRALFTLSATWDTNATMSLRTQHIKSEQYLFSADHLVTVTQKNRYRKEGLAPVVYLQSNCNVPSDRDRWVQELMRHIKVDSYGKCLQNKNFPFNSKLRKKEESWDSSELVQFLARYKFIIAAENANCDGYVTEKLYRALHAGVVPIYRGASDVGELVPDRSGLIEVTDDYERNPKLLANFLKDLDNDDHRYLSYLAWKDKKLARTNYRLKDQLDDRDWSPEPGADRDIFRAFECHVCRKLGQGKLAQPKVNQICSKPVPALGLNSSSLDQKDPWLVWQFEWDNARRFAEQDLTKLEGIVDRMGLTKKDQEKLYASKTGRDEL